MSFPAQPLDGNGVPIACTYVHDDNFYAMIASTRKKTDFLGNTSTAPVFEVRTQEDIRSQVVFMATTKSLATATNPNVVVGASLFNPSGSGKTVLVLSAKTVQGAANNVISLWLTTTDPQLGAPTVLTIANASAGGNASSLAGLSPVPVTSSANNASVSATPAGTQIDTHMMSGAGSFDFIPAGMGFILPSGAGNGLAIYTTIPTAGNTYAMTFRWIEY